MHPVTLRSAAASVLFVHWTRCRSGQVLVCYSQPVVGNRWSTRLATSLLCAKSGLAATPWQTSARDGVLSGLLLQGLLRQQTSMARPFSQHEPLQAQHFELSASAPFLVNRLGPYFWMCCFFVMKKALPGRLVPGSGAGGFGACVAGTNARALAAAVLLLAPRGPSAGAAFGAASACGASLCKSTAAGPPGAGAAFGAVSTSGRTLGNSTMAGNPSTDAAAFASLRGRVLNCLCRLRTHLRRARVVSNVLRMSGRTSRLRNLRATPSANATI